MSRQIETPQVGRDYSFKQLADMGYEIESIQSGGRWNTTNGHDVRELTRGPISVFTQHIPGKPYDRAHVSQTVMAVISVSDPFGAAAREAYILKANLALGPKCTARIPEAAQ